MAKDCKTSSRESVKVTIKGRSKLGYLNGTKKKPKGDEQALIKWEEENSQVMAWLIQTMQPNIVKNYLFIEDASELWKAVKESFSTGSNDGSMTYKFLAGLRSEFDHICSMVISRTPFPTLAEAFSVVRTEDMRRKAMPKERNMEASGMTVKDWKNSDKKKRDSKDDRWCDHCNKPRHDRANCWVLHGRPELKNKAKQVAAHVAETTRTEESETVFSKQQMAKLLRMLDLHASKTVVKVKYVVSVFVARGANEYSSLEYMC
ncbi:hypothetical protein Acr_28g0004350 [Actinidia rufa]|uniref:Retrotransposon gag domain-containing protein n=1 Tax=Actinidia rufa TaxID=165716 RepID=A0A7J0H9C7_9ERIC|nr:hypothetical protein Acr_28g0004350 [Actinidia rufa]